MTQRKLPQSGHPQGQSPTTTSLAVAKSPVSPPPTPTTSHSSKATAFVEAAATLVATLASECVCIEGERRAYRELDTNALVARLTERRAFVDRAARQSRQVEQLLVKLERSDVVRQSLAEVRAAARRLHTIESENTALIRRTQSVLTSVLDTVAPAAKTYDIRGQRRARPIAAYARVSRRV